MRKAVNLCTEVCGSLYMHALTSVNRETYMDIHVHVSPRLRRQHTRRYSGAYILTHMVGYTHIYLSVDILTTDVQWIRRALSCGMSEVCVCGRHHSDLL